MNPVVRVAATLAVTFAALLTSTAALAVDSGDIVIVSLKGEVYVTMSGAKRAVRAGSVLDPPAVLRTGRDGAVELRQGATTLSVGPETLLEFPALEKRGAPIDRIVQPRGNVFYSIGKREGRKLRIETPYLVGVVKGTQFNVAAQDETTTISLFEGLLEVHAADESGVVDLRAGEIASRRHDDKGVSVIKMDGIKAPAAPSRQPAGSGSNNSEPKPASPRATPHHQDRDSVLVDSSVAPVSVGAGVATAVDAAGPRVDVGPASVDTSVAASVSAPAIEVLTATAVDAGPATVDTSVSASLTTPAIEVATATAVDVGPVSVDAAPTIEVGSVTNADVGAGAATGPLTTEVGIAAAVNTDTGSDGLTVTVGASRNQVEVTVGSATAADAVSNSGPGNGNGNVDVAVDLGVDLGLVDDATTPATDNSGTDKPGNGPPAGVVEMLDDLLRHRGKK